MPKLKAKTATTVQPITSYPHLWLADMHIRANDPNGRVSITGRLVPRADLEDGTVVLHSDPRKAIPVHIPDVFASIEANPTGKLAIAFQAVLEALVEEVPQIEGLE